MASLLAKGKKSRPAFRLLMTAPSSLKTAPGKLRPVSTILMAFFIVPRMAVALVAYFTSPLGGLGAVSLVT